MLPLAVIGWTEWILIAGVLAMMSGGPLLIAVFALGSWLRRSGRGRAFQTYLAAAVCGAIAGLALIGAFGVSVAIRGELRGHGHPLALVLMIGLWSIAGFAALACAFFGAWTVWRLIAAPPAQPTHTTSVS